MFANKFHLTYQHLGYDCLEELHRNRTKLKDNLPFDTSFYKNIPTVRYSRKDGLWRALVLSSTVAGWQVGWRCYAWIITVWNFHANENKVFQTVCCLVLSIPMIGIWINGCFLFLLLLYYWDYHFIPFIYIYIYIYIEHPINTTSFSAHQIGDDICIHIKGSISIRNPFTNLFIFRKKNVIDGLI